MQVDPMATSRAFSSAYGYALNNPIFYNDPSGLLEASQEQLLQFIANALSGYGGTWTSGSSEPTYFSEEDANAIASSPSGGSHISDNGDGTANGTTWFSDGNQFALTTVVGGKLDKSGGIVGGKTSSTAFDIPGSDDQQTGDSPNNDYVNSVIYDPFYEVAWDTYSWHLGVKPLNAQDFYQVVFVGKGGANYALKNVGKGSIAVINLNDPNNILNIFNLMSGDKLLDVGMGAVGLYNEDPRNQWRNSFFDRLYDWTEAYDRPGYYWDTTGNPKFAGQYYTHDMILGKHVMKPSGVPVYK